MCHLYFSPPSTPLVGRVRQQGDVAGPLDRFGQHALVRRTITGDSSRQNLAAFGKVVLQQPDVFKVDKVYFVDTKPAHASPVHTAAAAAAAHWASILIVITVVATTTALAV